MKIQYMRNHFVASIGALLLSGAVQATTLVLPEDNYLSTGTYNDFKVLSFDLLQSCSVDQPLLCGTNTSQYPVQSSPGIISPQMVFLTGSNGMKNNSVDNGWMLADNPYLTPSGNQSATFRMGAQENVDGGVNNSFAGDQNGSWEVTLGTLRSYLKGELVFIFDNNQQMRELTDWLLFWGQASIIDTNGVIQECYEISTGTDCNPSPNELDPSLSPLNSGLFLPVVTGFCVDKSDGQQILSGGQLLVVRNQGQCPANSYFVNNNIATSVAEFGAYNTSLTAAVKNTALYGDNYLLSINIRYFGNNGGFEQAWICSDCTFDRNVPEPASMLLAGLGLVGLAALRRRKQQV